MVARNDITGDAIQSKKSNELFESNFDRIFRKNKNHVVEVEAKKYELVKDSDSCFDPCTNCAAQDMKICKQVTELSDACIVNIDSYYKEVT